MAACTLRKVVLGGDAARVEELLLSQSWSAHALSGALEHVTNAGVANAFARAASHFFHAGGATEALLSAAKGGRTETVEALLNSGVPADFSSCWADSGEDDLQLLEEEYAKSEATIAPLVVGRGIKMHPLHAAAANGHPTCARLLLEKGALVDEVDVYGWTALHYAVGKCCIECVHVLLDAGANVDSRGPRGDTPLLLACSCDPSSCFSLELQSVCPLEEEKRSHCVAMLLEHGADVNTTNDLEHTPLWRAVQFKNQIMETLINHGGNATFKTSNGETILHKLLSTDSRWCTKCEKGMTGEIISRRIETLVEMGVDVNAKTNEGESPLHCALLHRNQEAVLTLLRLGANKEMLRQQRRSSVQWKTVVETITYDAEFKRSRSHSGRKRRPCCVIS